MKFTTVIFLALPAFIIAAPVSDSDWLAQHGGHHEGHHENHEHHKHYEGPTPTHDPYPTQSVAYGGYKRSQHVKKANVAERDSYEPYPLPAYPTQSVSYRPHKRFAKRNANSAPEPVSIPQSDLEAKNEATSEVLTA